MTDEFTPRDSEEKLLPERFPDEDRESPAQHSSWGSVVAVLIILVIMGYGAVYFWGVHQSTASRRTPPPYIPGDATTTIVISTTSTSTAQ